MPRITAANPQGMLLVATNPVDVLTLATWRLSGLPPQRGIGSGTILDTERFRHLPSQHRGVDARSVDVAFVQSGAVVRRVIEELGF